MIERIKYIIFSIIFLVFLFAKYGNIEELCNFTEQMSETVEKTTDKIKEDISVQAVTKEDGTILRIIDGDTYVIVINGIGTTVRLIGIDTPESESHTENLVNTEYGIKVSQYAHELLPEGTKVWLKYDKETEDDYGRTLAYVFTRDKNGNSYMVNEKLLKLGYARAAYYSPNDKYRNKFKELHIKAKSQGKGFWGLYSDPEKGFNEAFPTKIEMEY